MKTIPSYPETGQIKDIITDAERIVIMQADNPDGDSLASALALEHILGDMGKHPSLYCGVDIPSYLRYLSGWDRVSKELPAKFDASVIVDTSSDSLFDSLEKSGQKSSIAAKPVIIVDHHPVENSLPFTGVLSNHPAVATAEVIYELAANLDWPVSREAAEMLAVAILSDSLGLTSEGTTSRSIHIIGELVENGVSLAKLEHNRREMMRKSPELVAYKGRLLQRIEYYDNNRIALITIPWTEIEQYSHAYNPSMLVIDDMRLSEGTDIAIAFKTYRDGKVTAKIRCNFGRGVGGDLAAAFGGGGHRYASGFKIQDGRSFDDIKKAVITKASGLLDILEQSNQNETA